MSLPADEFLRRFLCHVLPSGFQRIRHYGLLASRNKHDCLTRCRQLLGMPAPEPLLKKTTAEWVLLLLGIDVKCCPRCGQKTLQRTTLVPVRVHLPVTASAATRRPAGDDTS